MSGLLETLLDGERRALCDAFDAIEAEHDRTPAEPAPAPPDRRAVREPSDLERVGRWVAWHYRQRAMQGDTQTAARQLRKQGYPLDVALMILAPRVNYLSPTACARRQTAPQ